MANWVLESISKELKCENEHGEPKLAKQSMSEKEGESSNDKLDVLFAYMISRMKLDLHTCGALRFHLYG